ncbi:hypothetical protein CTEN210_12674 [Chaetoceros tenuissimus]|uniref:Uncharacterized protein n=1 Tax=Chaetoceros tenuissimus TaxID=426638 RepID=A0AAD3D1S1_9STRA|nr:hypothetical protein CTEN210_12674 [Chaetoceros tenuissimus]
MKSLLVCSLLVLSFALTPSYALEARVTTRRKLRRRRDNRKLYIPIPQAPSSTKPPSSKAPSSSTKQPSSKAPSSSTKQPSSKASSSSTKQPSSKAPSSSTKQPSSSTKQPSSSTKQPSSSTKQPTLVTSPPIFSAPKDECTFEAHFILVNFTMPDLTDDFFNMTEDDDMFNITDNFTFPTLPPGYLNDGDGAGRRLEDIPLPDPYVSVYRGDKYNECKPGQTPYPFWCEVIGHQGDSFFDYFFDYYSFFDYFTYYETPDEMKEGFDRIFQLQSAHVIKTFNAGGTEQWYCVNHLDVVEETGLLPMYFLTLNGEMFDLEMTMNDDDDVAEDYCISISCDDSCGCSVSPIHITMN